MTDSFNTPRSSITHRSSTLSPALSFLALNLGGWTLVALFFATQFYAYELSVGATVSFWDTLRSALIEWHIWAALTPFIISLSRRVPIASPVILPNGVLHLAASVVFAFFHIALHALLHIGSQPMLVEYLWQQPALFPSVFSALALRLLTDIFHLNFITYWLIIGGEHLSRHTRLSHERDLNAAALQLEAAALQIKTAALQVEAATLKSESAALKTQTSLLEAQLAKAQLGALKMQLQPHFLFNAMNAIATLVHKDADAAELMVMRLSRFLRLTLDAHRDTHPLWQEIEFIDTYLAIEEVRFGDRLKAEFDLQPDSLEALVPSLILQPLVENAVRHGISRRTASGHIVMRASRHGDTLMLSIEDDGAGLAASSPKELKEGIGLSNTRARLRQLYGDAGILTIHSLSPHGTKVTLALPIQLEGSATPVDQDAPQHLHTQPVYLQASQV